MYMYVQHTCTCVHVCATYMYVCTWTQFLQGLEELSCYTVGAGLGL